MRLNVRKCCEMMGRATGQNRDFIYTVSAEMFSFSFEQECESVRLDIPERRKRNSKGDMLLRSYC